MRVFVIISLMAMVHGIIFAEAQNDTDIKKKLTPEIYVGLQTGQYVKSRYTDYTGPSVTYRHLWVGDMIGRIGLNAVPSDWFSLNISLEACMWYNNWPVRKKADPNWTLTPNYAFYIHDAYGRFSFLKNIPDGGLNISLGQFVYKYNPEVRDLGEYLFRTGTYPAYIINKFDFPMAKLTGLRLNFRAATSAHIMGQSLFSFNLDGLLLMEREMMPFHDFTLAFIGNVNAFKAIDVGAGVSFAHVWSVDDSNTTPKTPDNIYFTSPTDTGYYTFKGTKLMFRATIDPVFFLRGKQGFAGDFFGKEGFKLYSELAFLGLKDYPIDSINNPYGYDDLTKRRPILLGFTLPLWKIVDVFAVELEHFDCPYQNNYSNVIRYNHLPLPLKVSPSEPVYDSTVYTKDSWKFCIYAKKNVGENVSFILQASRDHQGWESGGETWRNRDYGEAFTLWDEWSWHFKTEYRF